MNKNNNNIDTMFSVNSKVPNLIET